MERKIRLSLSMPKAVGKFFKWVVNPDLVIPNLVAANSTLDYGSTKENPARSCSTRGSTEALRSRDRSKGEASTRQIFVPSIGQSARKVRSKFSQFPLNMHRLAKLPVGFAPSVLRGFRCAASRHGRIPSSSSFHGRIPDPFFSRLRCPGRPISVRVAN
jgi:hypothetical protein